MTWFLAGFALTAMVHAFRLTWKVRQLTESEEMLRKDRDHYWERLVIADGAYMACRVELDRLQSVRSEAGRKAAATRKLRALAEGTGE